MTGGLHIHTGSSCSSATYVGPHYYATSTDPWTTTYDTTSTTGTSSGSFSVSAGTDLAVVSGKTVVVHDSSGSRTGCGVIGARTVSAHSAVSSCTATISGYPGYSGTAPSGTVTVTTSNGTGSAEVLNVAYSLASLTANETGGGLHVHTGTSCSNSSYVGGHYYATSSDPWSTNYDATTVNGTSSGSFTVSAGLSLAENSGHAVVVHAASGTRIGCGVLTCSPAVAAPSPPNSGCSGTFSVTPTSLHRSYL